MDKEDQGDTCTGRAEIVTAVGSEYFRTIVADIFLVSHIGIADTDKGLQSPPATQHPVIPVSQAATIQFTPVILFFQSGNKGIFPILK